MKTKLENLNNKTKLTKKEYFKLMEENIHYNIGTIYRRPSTGEYTMTEDELTKAINERFLNLEFLWKECLCCISCKQNTVDFLHVKKDGVEKLHEQKKGQFYIIDVDKSRSVVLHYYNDSTDSISFKIVVKTTSVLDIIN